MLKNAKKCITVFLAMVMAVSGLFAAALVTAQNAEASTRPFLLTDIVATSEFPLKVECGQNFNIGDYVSVVRSMGNETSVSLLPGVHYSSDHSNVASVDQRGNVKTLATGTVTITVLYSQSKRDLVLKVIPSGKYAKRKGVAAVAAAAKTLEDSMPSEVTTENGYALLKNFLAMEKALKKYPDMAPAGATIKDEWLVPQVGVYYRAKSLLDIFAFENSPTAVTSANQFKIRSISASTKKNRILITLKEPVTEEQVLAQQIEKRSMKAVVDVPVKDLKYSGDYVGMGAIKAGSRTIQLRLKSCKYNTNTWKIKYSPQKLKKGHIYQIGDSQKQMYGYWARGKKVRAKK